MATEAYLNDPDHVFTLPQLADALEKVGSVSLKQTPAPVRPDTAAPAPGAPPKMLDRVYINLPNRTKIYLSIGDPDQENGPYIPLPPARHESSTDANHIGMLVLLPNETEAAAARRINTWVREQVFKLNVVKKPNGTDLQRAPDLLEFGTYSDVFAEPNPLRASQKVLSASIKLTLVGSDKSEATEFSVVSKDAHGDPVARPLGAFREKDWPKATRVYVVAELGTYCKYGTKWTCPLRGVNVARDPPRRAQQRPGLSFGGKKVKTCTGPEEADEAEDGGSHCCADDAAGAFAEPPGFSAAAVKPAVPPSSLKRPIDVSPEALYEDAWDAVDSAIARSSAAPPKTPAPARCEGDAEAGDAAEPAEAAAGDDGEADGEADTPAATTVSATATAATTSAAPAKKRRVTTAA